jgi:CBS domain-containing protein
MINIILVYFTEHILQCTAHNGMTVTEIFTECLSCHVPGLPFVDGQGQLTKDFHTQYPQAYLFAGLFGFPCGSIGDLEGYVSNPILKAHIILAMPIETFLLEDHPSTDSQSPPLKAIALMERYDTTYLFIVDEGEYKGIVTILGIARGMLDLQK